MYHPAGSPPFLMCDNGKKARNNYGGEKETKTKVTRTRVTRTKVIRTKVMETRTKVIEAKVRGTKVTKTVTKVMEGDIKGRIPEGGNTTHCGRANGERGARGGRLSYRGLG